ncbi:hypothetical protein [Tsuneonella sp. HG222]
MIGLAHVVALVALARAFAPDFTAELIDDATSLVTVTVYTPPPPEATPPPPEEPVPDEGRSGEEARQATPKEVSAPPAPPVNPSPVPKAASTGDASASGAAAAGQGTGGGGPGDGTGSGRGGQGAGNAIVTRPSVRSGSINVTRDFPTPDGGFQAIRGTSVIVQFIVGVDGRASNCSVSSPGPDPEINARVCPLVVDKIRFNPATDANGNPVAARYGWRQDFFAGR